jgi:arabinogalactan endo-1,4-beta-galactosidase
MAILNKTAPIVLAVPALLVATLSSCGAGQPTPTATPSPSPVRVPYAFERFVMGADLSYVNQIQDHGGVYKDGGQVRDPFRIFKDHGTNLVRLRLWNNPTWTRTVYGDAGTQMYSDLADVEKSIRRAKDQGLTVLLDFHYSDTWADPGTQRCPAAWQAVADRTQLTQLLYQYTYDTLRTLDGKGLMPEMVQLGNEINCGLFFTDAAPGFPSANCCSGQWPELGQYLNAGIRAVRDASANASVKPQVALHVADPSKVQRWFDNITHAGGVTDFDVVGCSYYPLWHTAVALSDMATLVSGWRSRYGKKVMVLETAYPWTPVGADSYANSLGSQPPLAGYPFTVDGQSALLAALARQVVSGGGQGVVYWEPDWITSQMKDLWGTGSSWENCALFDFNGNVQPSIDYMTGVYAFPSHATASLGSVGSKRVSGPGARGAGAPRITAACEFTSSAAGSGRGARGAGAPRITAAPEFTSGAAYGRERGIGTN